MQIHEILDRLEVLYPDNSVFSDLRKALLSEDKFALFRVIQTLTDSQLVEGMRKFKDDESFNKDCFSRGQLQSKLWLVEELKKLKIDLDKVFLCAGWYGTLATMIFESGMKVDTIRSFDMDPSCAKIAETFNKKWFENNWQFKASTVDILDFNWTTDPAPSDGTLGNFYYMTEAKGKQVQMKDRPNTIINTSCEHIEYFEDWYDIIPEGTLVVLQTNNYFEIKEHVNCVQGPIQFANQTPMKKCLYQGSLNLPGYTRFMRIGIK